MYYEKSVIQLFISNILMCLNMEDVYIIQYT